eukprot:1338182-Amphidinium_carterae.1
MDFGGCSEVLQSGCLCMTMIVLFLAPKPQHVIARFDRLCIAHLAMALPIHGCTSQAPSEPCGTHTCSKGLLVDGPPLSA